MRNITIYKELVFNVSLYTFLSSSFIFLQKSISYFSLTDQYCFFTFSQFSQFFCCHHSCNSNIFIAFFSTSTIEIVVCFTGFPSWQEHLGFTIYRHAPSSSSEAHQQHSGGHVCLCKAGSTSGFPWSKLTSVL